MRYAVTSDPLRPSSGYGRWEFPAAFTIRTALDRIARSGAPWSDVLTHKHDLRALVERT